MDRVWGTASQRSLITSQGLRAYDNTHLPRSTPVPSLRVNLKPAQNAQKESIRANQIHCVVVIQLLNGRQPTKQKKADDSHHSTPNESNDADKSTTTTTDHRPDNPDPRTPAAAFVAAAVARPPGRPCAGSHVLGLDASMTLVLVGAASVLAVCANTSTHIPRQYHPQQK